jgi:hypothetical protein
VRQSRSINHENFVRWNTKLKRFKCFSSVACFNLPKWFDNRLIQIVLLKRFKRKTRKKKILRVHIFRPNEWKVGSTVKNIIIRIMFAITKSWLIESSFTPRKKKLGANR